MAYSCSISTEANELQPVVLKARINLDTGVIGAITGSIKVPVIDTAAFKYLDPKLVSLQGVPTLVLHSFKQAGGTSTGYTVTPYITFKDVSERAVVSKLVGSGRTTATNGDEVVKTTSAAVTPGLPSDGAFVTVISGSVTAPTYTHGSYLNDNLIGKIWSSLIIGIDIAGGASSQSMILIGDLYIPVALPARKIMQGIGHSGLTRVTEESYTLAALPSQSTAITSAFAGTAPTA